jgi:hypothetical protein
MNSRGRALNAKATRKFIFSAGLYHPVHVRLEQELDEGGSKLTGYLHR